MIKKTAFRAILAAGVSLAAFPATGWAQAADEASADSGAIVVTGQRQQYRGDVSLEDLPQSVQVLDSKLLTDLNITEFDSALDLASGISRQNNFGGLWDAFAVRGFAGDENFPSGFLVNGFNGGRGYGGPRDASNIERIEVLKGPNGAVFGRGEPGGTVNIITKKATLGDTFGSVSASAGSFDTYRGEGDVNVAISDKIAFRVNGAIESSDGFRDYVDTEKYVATPSVLFQLSDSTSLSYEMEFVDLKIPFDRGVVAVDGKLGVIPRSRFLGEPGDGPTEVDVLGHQVQLQQDLGSNDWVLLVGFGYRDTSFKGFSSDAELVDGRQILDDDGMTLARQRRYRKYDTTNTSLRAEVSGRVYTGSITHHVLLGADWDRFKIYRYQSRFRPGPYTYPDPITAANNAINIFNPVYGQTPTPDTLLQDFDEVQKAYGIYFQDQIDLTDKFKIRLGGRYDHFAQVITDKITKNRFSPTAGALYQATDTLGVYAAYGTGFRPNSGTNFFGDPFSPETSKSYEMGLRYVSPDKNITGTLAAYWMKKNNILTNDPNPDHSGFSITGGSARSRGIEADINAKLPGDIDIYATYAFIDAEWRSAALDVFSLSIEPGDPLINIPKHTINFLVTKGFEFESLGKFTVGAGVNYVSKRLGETASDFYLPDYTLVRLLANYEPSESVRLSVDVTNLFNEEYYPASYHRYWVAPGQGRAVTFRATYSF